MKHWEEKKLARGFGVRDLICKLIEMRRFKSGFDNLKPLLHKISTNAGSC